MARARNDAAVKKRINNSMKAALQTTPVSAPPPPPPPPVVNFYTDRITTYEQFRQFLFNQVGKEYGRIDDEHWPAYARQALVDGLQSLVGGHNLVDPDKSSAEDRARIFEPYDAFYKMFHALWAPRANRKGVHLNWTPETWRYFRDMIRFRSSKLLLTSQERMRREAERTLFRVDGNNEQKIVGTREVLPYLKQLFTKHHFFFDPAHFLHLSPRDPNYICYTPDERHSERDIVVETTISKYVKKFFPATTDAVLREIADLHKYSCVEDGIQFFSSLEDMLRVYRDGPGSCMSKADNAYNSHIHPLAAYANRPGVRLAAMRATGGEGTTYSARAFVYEPEDDSPKRFIRIYGSDLMKARLLKRGYVHGDWAGATLNKIPALDRNGDELKDTWVLPYLDCVVHTAVQSVVTNSHTDHWAIGTEDQCRGLGTGVKGAVWKSATSAGGLVGTYEAYNRRRHAYWRAQITGERYVVPTQTTFNEHDEIACFHCTNGCERPYVVPLRTTVVTEELGHAPVIRWACDICTASMMANKMLVPLENQQHEGMPLLGYYRVVFSIPREGIKDEIRSAHEGAAVLRHTTPATHIYTTADRLEDYGYVQLSPDYYPPATTAARKHATQLDNGWVRTEDLVTTVFNEPAIKQRCWFLGQNVDEALQFFPQDPIRLARAFKLGRFFVEGNKITYDPKGSFRPTDRRATLKRTGEYDEDIENLTTAERVPLVEVFNVFYGYWGYRNGLGGIARDNVLEALHQILPRVDFAFLMHCSKTYMGMRTDEFAGVDGITSLSPQMRAIFHASYSTSEGLFGPKPPGKSRAPVVSTPYFTFAAHTTTPTFSISTVTNN